VAIISIYLNIYLPERRPFPFHIRDDFVEGKKAKTPLGKVTKQRSRKKKEEEKASKT